LESNNIKYFSVRCPLRSNYVTVKLFIVFQSFNLFLQI